MNRAVPACLCLFALVCPSWAAALVPNDFAAGFVLPGADGTGIHVVELPPAVYEKAQRPDLADVRVFNGAGEAVPHVVRGVAGEDRAIRRAVPFFPLPGVRSAQTGDLSLRVALQPDGTVLAVDAGTRTPAPPAGSYLLDTARWNGTGPSALELHWRSPSTGLLTLSLMHSSDLVHWSPLVDRVVLADLSYQGSQVVARRISLPGKPLPYIRLDCIDCREPLLLREVVGLTGPPVADEEWQWARLRADRATEEQGQRIIAYRLEAKMAVTAVQLRFPTANSLLRAVIEARSANDGPWRQVVRADFYRLDREGTPLVNPPATCPPIPAPEWRIRVVADHAGLEGKGPLPELDLGWRRQEILFLGRGQGPYLLAFGSARAAGADSGQDTLVLAALRQTGTEAHVRRIVPGAPVSLGGDRALQPDAAASWQQILLWLVLVAGVGLLAVMARKLLRELPARTD